MKTRISFFLLALFAVASTSLAQKYLNVYQDNTVIQRIASSLIDSISVTSSTPRIVEMWKNGSVFQSYAIGEIDSIKVSADGEPMSYIGIIGFNDELNKKEIGVLAKSTASQYRSFVSRLSQRDGTLLYYAVDNALDMLEAFDFKTPIRSVNIITFTDGLDLGSMMMSNTYWTAHDYLDAMGRRISSTQIAGLPLNAYTVGLRGRDVTDGELFKNNIVSLASSAGNAFEVSSMSDVRTRLQNIANRIINITNLQTVSVKVPGIDHGSRMRFVFDGQSVENSQLYIEGTFSMADRSLHNVTYHGMRARSGSVVQGTQNGIFLTYTFRSMQRLDGNGLVPTNNIKHYYQLPSGDWQVNSEFRSDNIKSIRTYTGTAIFLVLDCSSSLGSDISKIKDYANEFIDMVAANALPVDVEVEAPQNVHATMDNEANVVNVTWDAVRFAESYNVYRSSTATGTFALVADNVTTNSWTDDTAGYGPRYYKVCAVGYGMTSEMSAASERVDILPPGNFIVEVNGVSFTMVKVEGGTFQMGSETGDSYENERPVHQVTLTNDYYIGETEVTQGLWEAVMGSNPSNFTGSDQLPVEYVSWEDCQTFITKLNELTGKHFRLPTEAEWEFAARGGNASQGYLYSGSNTLDDVAWYRDNSNSQTHAVGTKAPNELGIYDMSGNVWEWCQDWYGDYSSGAQVNPTGSSDVFGRVCRGGGWRIHARFCRSSYRRSSTPSVRDYDLGLRLALVNNVVLPPQNVHAAMDDSRFVINVTWDAVNYAESYNVYRSSTATGTFALVADNVTTNSWTDDTAGYGSKYYKVCAVGNGMTSEMSAASEGVAIEYVVHPEYNIKMEVNGVSFTMVKVEGGTFKMGSEAGDTYDNERPVHQVTLTNDYCIGETEVTQGLWKAVMGSNPSRNTGSDQLPVEYVSWEDCQAFITKLNELTGKHFRLPTEAEWEFAARGGNASQGYLYSGSNIVDDVAWYWDNSNERTHEVGTKAPNELGIYDMSGNVCEWCQDWDGDYSSGAQTNPTGPSSGYSRVDRGGNWLNNAWGCRSSCRDCNAPSFRLNYIGLRLAL